MKTNYLSLLCVFIICVSQSTLAQNNRFDGVEYEVTDLGHGIHMLVSEGGNIGLSIGDDGAFLIDDQFAPLTPKLLKAVGDLTDQPVKYVINTHWHGDHTGGNANLAATGTVVVAHDNVRSRMAAPGPKQSPADALPVITFSDTTTYYLNGHKIHAFHVEHAHTDGDVIIHFPDLNIIHAGDTLFNGLYPFIDLKSGGSLDGYFAAMNQLLAIADDDTKIIPGHGPLCGRVDVERSINMLKEAKKRIAALVEKGMTLEEIQAADPLADYNDDWTWRFINGERLTQMLFTELSR